MRSRRREGDVEIYDEGQEAQYGLLLEINTQQEAKETRTASTKGKVTLTLSAASRFFTAGNARLCITCIFLVYGREC